MPVSHALAAFVIALIIMQTDVYYSIFICKIQFNIYDTIMRKIDYITIYKHLIYLLVLG